MMHIILEEFLTINGRSIYCKVLSPTPQLTNKPWLLCVPGGPGFGHLSPQQKIDALEKLAGEQHPRYPAIGESLEKLLEGKILNEKDYIHSIAFTLAPLYSEDMERTLSGLSGFLVKNFLPSLIPVLNLVVSAGKKLSMNMAGLEFMIEGLTGCSVPVLNQFCRTGFNQFNLQQQIAQHSELYKRINISLISCNQDHMVDFRTALAIHNLLPDSSAAIILNERHIPTAGPHKDLMIKMMRGILCQGRLSRDLLSSDIISSNSMNSNFLTQLERLNGGALFSTASIMAAIGAPLSGEDNRTRSSLPETSVPKENKQLIEVFNQPQSIQGTNTCVLSIGSNAAPDASTCSLNM